MSIPNLRLSPIGIKRGTSRETAAGEPFQRGVAGGGIGEVKKANRPKPRES
jgi:hypothetical protein